MAFCETKKSFIYTTSAILLLVFSLYGHSESKPTIPTLQIRRDINATEQNSSQDPAEKKHDLLSASTPGEKDDAALSDKRDDNALLSGGARKALGQRATPEGEDMASRFKRDTTPNPCVVGHKLKLIDRETVVLTVICAEGCREIKRVYFLKNRDIPLTFAVDCRS